MSRLFPPKLVENRVGRRSSRSRTVAAVASPHMADGLLEAVRGLWLADPDLSVKPLLAKLREQQPDLGAGNKRRCARR